MNPAPTFDRVYVALKRLIMSGRFRPGARLEPVHIGDELRASITPVRDALYRLMGDGLVEAGETDGFAVAAMAETDLRDLYHWNRQLLGLALRHVPAEPASRVQPDPTIMDDADRAAALFSAIVHHAESGEHQRAIERANDRLHASRLAETRVAEIGRAGLDGIAEAWAQGSVTELRRHSTDYHRRRVAHVAQIVRVLRSGEGQR